MIFFNSKHGCVAPKCKIIDSGQLPDLETMVGTEVMFSPTGSALRLRYSFFIVSGIGYAKRPELYAWQLVSY